MKRRSLLLILLIVLLPVGLLTWLGLRVARDEQAMTQQRFKALMEQRLQDVNRVVGSQLQATEKRLREITAIDTLDVEHLRQVVRSEPQVTQLFVLSPEGTLLYPNPADPLNGTELSFLRQASRMFTDRDLHSAVAHAESKLGPGDLLTNSMQQGGNFAGSEIMGGPIFQEIVIAANGLDAARTEGTEAMQFQTAGKPQYDLPIRSTIEPAPQQTLAVNADENPGQQDSVTDRRTGAVNIADLNAVAGGAASGASGEALVANSDVADLAPQADTVISRNDEALNVEESAALPSATPVPSDPSEPSELKSVSSATAADSDSTMTDLGAIPVDPSSMPSRGLRADPSSAGSVIPQVQLQVPQARDMLREFLPSSGWFVWYWDRGLNLVYWQRRPSGHIVGAALERARWIADLIAVLPDSDQSMSRTRTPEQLDEGFRVVTSAAEPVYEWGRPIPVSASPLCEVPMVSPLASWRIQSFVPAEQLMAGTGQRAFVTAISGLSVVTLTLCSLAWLLYRDYSRDMREAGQQVSFVNQVSHELKTPLTNIRLYSELLDRDLDHLPLDHSEKPRRRLEVISAEAQRLSRLIGNVLTFARQQRKSLQVQVVPTNPGEVVRQIAERFAPSLAEHGLAVTVDADECRVLQLDPDFIEQILGNLVSNVEKYAADGKQLTIRCRCDEGSTTIDVIDHGPGIPSAQRADVFRPFARLSSDLRASSGTGIGLSIARDLARLHGGDVVLLDAPGGCCFRVTLKSS